MTLTFDEMVGLLKARLAVRGISLRELARLAGTDVAGLSRALNGDQGRAASLLGAAKVLTGEEWAKGTTIHFTLSSSSTPTQQEK